jgi:hypothetical protein
MPSNIGYQYREGFADRQSLQGPNDQPEKQQFRMQDTILHSTHTSNETSCPPYMVQNCKS